MAGDYLPIRLDLARDPAIIRIATITGVSVDSAVGGVIRVWSWFNEQTDDGSAHVTVEALQSFGLRAEILHAMRDVGWLHIGDDGTMSIPHWERWNSQSAKTRLKTRDRVQRHRAAKRDGNGACVTKASPQIQGQGHSKNPPNPPGGGAVRPRGDALENGAGEIRDRLLARFHASGSSGRDRQVCASAAVELRARGATADDVDARLRRWRFLYPCESPTVRQLVRRWSKLTPPKPMFAEDAS